MEKEQPNLSSSTKTKAVERENSIIRCYEISSDLTLLYLQKADKALAANAGQFAGQSTWSVVSTGTTGSTSPIQPSTGMSNGNHLAVVNTPAVGQENDHHGVSSPKMGSILECALYRAAVLNINQGKPVKAVTRLRSMLMAEETDSTTQIRQNVCCQLAEVLVSNCSNTKYVRPDLDAIPQTKRSNRHTFNRDHQSYGSGSIGSGNSSNENPWKPLRQALGRDVYIPKNKYEELVLILLLSEYIANKEAILSQGPTSASGRKATFDSATVTYDLLTLPLARFSNYRLLCDMLERSMKFSFQEKHSWEQFALVLTSEGRYFRSLLVFREISERLKKEKVKMMDVGSFLSAARICYEHLGLYEEGISWAMRALDSEEVRDNNYMAARANVYVGIGHLISARSVENLTDRKKRIAKAGQFFELARQRDDQDHFAEFYLAYYYAQTRQIKKATLHVRNALNLHSYHLPSLHLMILLLSSNQDYAEALELTEQTMEEYPEHLGIMTLKIKLQEMIHGTEVALMSAKEMMQHWQIMVEEIQQNMEDMANLNSTGGNEFGTSFNVGQYPNLIRPGAASEIATGSSFGALGPASVANSAQMEYGTLRSGGGPGIPSHYDTLSDKDSISLHAHSVTASHVEKTLSEVASSFSFQMPQKPNPNDPTYSLMRIWLLIAELHLGQDNIAGAEMCTTEARSLSPLSYHLTHVRGLIYEAKEEFEGARQCYENALAVNPSHVQSLLHLANVYYKLGFNRLSEQTLNLALRTEPNNEQLWSLLGEVTEALGDELSNEAYQWENNLESSTFEKGNQQRAGRSDNESTDDEADERDELLESSRGHTEDEDHVDNRPINDRDINSFLAGRGSHDGIKHQPTNVRNRPQKLTMYNQYQGKTNTFSNTADNFDFFCVAEDESTPTNETVGSFANEAAKMFSKAAECQAVALSIENSSPILPFTTISLAFE